MSYRPITDMWILARAKLKGGRKYYGAYPGGFLERARALLGVTMEDPVLHVCGGMARHYPYSRGFGPNDATADLDPATEPDWIIDVRNGLGVTKCGDDWSACISDPPYTLGDAVNYVPGADKFPSPNHLVRDMIAVVRPGGRVGLLHYVWPRCPKNAVSVAAVGVLVGFGNRIRLFSVFERTA